MLAKHEIEAVVIRQLLARDFTSSVRTVVIYERQSPKPRGMGLDWHNYNESADVRALEIIFSAETRFMFGLGELQEERIRVMAALSYLWGESNLRKLAQSPLLLQGEVDAATETACRMLVFRAYDDRRMTSFVAAGVRTVRSVRIEDPSSCEPCKQHSLKVFKITEAPELPYFACTCSSGCRCRYRAVDR